ncbi:TenA family transcriptional regulator [Azohydromonas sediminis]|uniref:TenA family transcriptional regulator n=1 Tax=Azohydromonas sediminis TaxID=2259674 RepID=UPI000E64AE05|nr:iron-containing redox enzyme family protein [Azohydromonas sediminis]
MNAFFGQLVMRTDEARRAFETHPNVMDAVARGMSVERYRQFLLELYHVVWHFNPVCAAAASRLDDGLRDVRYFLYDHMHEEQGHEQWVLNDLDAVGVPEAQARAHAPSPWTLGLVGYNYWAAERRHPASALGMLYALEVIASVYGGPFASAIQESLLLDGQRGVSFVASHATMDAQHMAALREVLNAVRDEAARESIVESTQVNFHHFTGLVGQL